MSHEAELEWLTIERDTLLGFKQWVHAYLDDKGIPTHPDGPHSKEGCRIGDRMDAVFAELERLRVAGKLMADAIVAAHTAELRAAVQRAEQAEAELERLKTNDTQLEPGV